MAEIDKLLVAVPAQTGDTPISLPTNIRASNEEKLVLIIDIDQVLMTLVLEGLSMGTI